ncbi:hypothetical protein HNQ91_000532 [Filimonas zeae]|uniref:Peptidase M17 leucyl aminopeptidase N-terminal domain-containing protein n=1 Tax=Filimonas zeae TaxID=1737353 RepID=A0A917INB9_9BACT|nr:M17 family peptidase N-terminal domain-containing protein [Filimonas zeae]MDR6337510.1 hypothetical protein [Filimonas zeae]GGH58962.1 hypothetical protein GCM10011379_05210 [Filimonas zeae]
MNSFKHSSSILAGLILAFGLHTATLAQTTTADTTQKMTAINTSKVWGKVDGIAFEGLVQGPSTSRAPLQIACVFEYTEGDIFNPPALPAQLNGMVHLDDALLGIITDIRKSGQFKGHAYETLLIEPSAGHLSSKRLLLIGLGHRNAFTADLMTGIGAVAMREALRLNAPSFAFASDIKDAGIDSPTAEVAGNVVKGMVDAYRTQTYLSTKKMAVKKPVAKVTLLAGPSFFTVAGQGIQQAIQSFN